MQSWKKVLKFKAFTLSELIVVMVIIGFVTAIAGPMLYRTYKSKQFELGRNVLFGTLRSSMRTMQATEETLRYPSTMDFVKALSKHVKFKKICDSNHLYDCFTEYFVEGDTTFGCNPASSMGSSFGRCFSSGDYDEANLVSINNYRYSNKLGKSYNTENVGVVFENGISAVLTYDPNCKQSIGQSDDPSIIPCLGVLYDLNGRKKPNNTANDIGFINTELSDCKDGVRLNGKCWYLDDIQEGATTETSKNVNGVQRRIPSQYELADLVSSSKFRSQYSSYNNGCFQTNQSTGKGAEYCSYSYSYYYNTPQPIPGYSCYYYPYGNGYNCDLRTCRDTEVYERFVYVRIDYQTYNGSYYTYSDYGYGNCTPRYYVYVSD